MSSGNVEVRARRPEEVIADILAYFAAKKRYSYVDMIGNALDNIIALEVIKDAIRDFKSSCIDNPQPDDDAICPNITAEELDRAGDRLSSRLKSAETKDLILITREIAVKALARAPRFSKS